MSGLSGPSTALRAPMLVSVVRRLLAGGGGWFGAVDRRLEMAV